MIPNPLRIEFSFARLMISVSTMSIFILLPPKTHGFDMTNMLIGLEVGVISYLLLHLFSKLDIPGKSDESSTFIDQFEETVIVEGAACKICNHKNSRGKLFLTNNRLIFRSMKSDTTEIFLNNVSSVSLLKFMKLFNQGFTITVNGEEMKFKVDYPEDWKTIITLQMQK